MTQPPPPAPPAPTRARLSRALLLYYAGVVLVITLAPFRFAAPRHFVVYYGTMPFDLVANVLLFVPLGFLYPLGGPDGRRATVLRALAAGLLLSACIEAAQLFEPERYPSVVDLAANGVGALTGALLQRAAARRIRLSPAAVGRLALELPLMGLVYLLVPLLWLGSLAARDSALRVAPLLLLGLFGARLLAALQRHAFGPAGVLRVRGVALAAAGWAALGVFPALFFHPLAAAALVAVVAAAAAQEAARPDDAPAERRFEARALRRAAPAFAAYLLAMVLAPLASASGAWTGWLGFAGRSASLGVAEQLHLLESVAALTVLGYLLAEARSRRELPFGSLAPRLAAECALAAAAIEGVRGFHPAWGASLAQLWLLVGAGLLGGWIFHLQRDHVRALAASARRPAPLPAPETAAPVPVPLPRGLP